MKGFGLGIYKKLSRLLWLFKGVPVAECNTHDGDNYWNCYEGGATCWLSPAYKQFHVASYIANELKDATVLDLGCGFGRLNLMFNIARYYGTDTNKRMLENAIMLNQAKKNAYFLLGDGKTLHHFQNNFFDFIISNFVFLHLKVKTAEGYAEEIHRILKPNGAFIVNLPKKRLLNVPDVFRKFNIAILDDNFHNGADEVFKFTKEAN